MNAVEMFVRASLPSIRHASQVSVMLSEAFRSTDDLAWSWGQIKREFRMKNAEHLFHKYQARLQHSLFVLLLLLLVFQSTASIISYLILAKNQLETAVLPLTIRAFSLAVYFSFLLTSHMEHKFRTDRSRILSSIIILLTMSLTTHGSIIYYLVVYKEYRTGVRPTYYNLIMIYIMLPFPKKYQCTLAGIFATVSELLLTGLGISTDKQPVGNAILQLLADAVFYLVGGIVGFYIRFLMEMMNRKAFLDRRGCLESKIKLGFEKQQEENLLLSILPDHLAEQVQKDIRNVMKRIEKRPFTRAFNELYVERHSNVTILYADIVNSMKLAAKLEAKELVATLNELFARFDESADYNSCMRVKLLGDCYYCVAGVPNPDPEHADNSVQMGLDMIAIIRTVREERQVDVDMRIGVHTGSILCGLIGMMKWQYDIWSKDALIASHMEQSGVPGHVHITDVTFKHLHREFFIIPTNTHKKDPYLMNANLGGAYLISPIPITKRGSIFELNDYNKRLSLIKRSSLATASPVLRALKKSSVAPLNNSQGEAISSRDRKVLDYSYAFIIF